MCLKINFNRIGTIILPILLAACSMHSSNQSEVNTQEPIMLSPDVHSFSNPNEIRVNHLSLDLRVDFDKKILSGTAKVFLSHLGDQDTLHLDSRQLVIHSITLPDGSNATYSLTKPIEFFGSDLAVLVPGKAAFIRIEYETEPGAEALDWMMPEQTAGGKHPFMFSQSQAILARTWLPLQDSPGVKFTYDATIHTNPELLAVMSAENGHDKTTNGVYHFKMDQPVSSYLMAIAVGDLQFQSLGRNCGVFAEPGMLPKAAWEFADMQSMIDSAEALYGPYAWGQYDVVVLPPSFPFGGMENPRLTFATPTIIAGDRSLVSLIAHELAHSWSGNLVTNETWNDFWLNEGFTVYFEQRIMEKIYGKPYEEMLTVLGMEELKLTVADLEQDGRPNDTHLFLNLDGRNPDDGLTDIAYEKGRFFLQTVEREVGRDSFDEFLKDYFTENAFKPMNTKRFLDYLKDHLLDKHAGSAERINIDAWVYGPGIPANSPKPESAEFMRVENSLNAFMASGNVDDIDTSGWTTHHWLHFLRDFKKNANRDLVVKLDDAYHLTSSGNNEILCDWFQIAINTQYKLAYPSMERFLTSVGRRKFLTLFINYW